MDDTMRPPRRSLSEEARPVAAIPDPATAIEVLDQQDRELTSRIYTMVDVRGVVREKRAIFAEMLKPKPR
jgi:hypothetical protein